MTKKPCLLITHGPVPPRDYVAHHLRRLGHALEWRGLAKGHSLPAPDPSVYALTVIYGGPQLLSDLQPGEEYLLEEVEWVRTYVEAGGRLLGICLGAQILAKAFGGEVAPHKQGIREVGLYPVFATPEGREMTDMPAQMQVYHWHRDGFTLPEGATLLASGETFPNQAYTMGSRVLGVQFHPEITRGMIKNWAERAPAVADQAPGAQCRTTHLRQFERCQLPMRDWIEAQLACLLAA